MKNNYLKNKLLVGVTLVSMLAMTTACGNGATVEPESTLEEADESPVTLGENDTEETTDEAADESSEAATDSAEDAASEDIATEEVSAPDYESYTSDDGWTVSYYQDVIEVNEVDEHNVQFIYTGESTDTNMAVISFLEDTTPIEALDELAKGWGSDAEVTKSEGFFPGTSDKWGYWYTLQDTEGTGYSETVIAGEYNGGVLMFEGVFHLSGDDETDMAICDITAMIIDSVSYENFEDQTMYSEYPGTYSAESDGFTYSVVLNDDHTGALHMQDDIDVIWGDDEIIYADGSFTYEIELNGDELTLIDGDSKTVYTRE